MIYNVPSDFLTSNEVSSDCTDPQVIVHPFFFDPGMYVSRSRVHGNSFVRGYASNIDLTLARYAGPIFVLEEPEHAINARHYVAEKCRRTEKASVTPAGESEIFRIESIYNHLKKSGAARVNIGGGYLDWLEIQKRKDGSISKLDAGVCLGVILERMLAHGIRVNINPEIVYDYISVAHGKGKSIENTLSRISR